MSKPLNCPNCGAPVRGGECEYCGTVFTQPNDEMRSYPLPPHWMDWREYHERIDPGRTIRIYNPETHTWEWVGDTNPMEDIASISDTPSLPDLWQGVQYGLYKARKLERSGR